MDVFISYRRSDAGGDAGRLYDRLSAHFGGDHVFMDVDDIEPGQDFAQVLEDTLNRCNVLLVLIGPNWLDASSEDGAQRLQDPNDYVRIEVARALHRGVGLIPVLMNDASIPQPESLPAELRALCQRQAITISHQRFHPDVDALIASIEASYSKRWWPSAGFRRQFNQWKRWLIVLVAIVSIATYVVVTARMERDDEAIAHVQIAEQFVAGGDLDRAIEEYDQALVLKPKDLRLHHQRVKVHLAALQREAFPGGRASPDAALRKDIARFSLTPGAKVDAALRALFALEALDTALAEEPDNLLTQALILKASGARIAQSLKILEAGYVLAKDHVGIMSELGLMRAVLNADVSGLQLLQRAAKQAPGDARIQFYLGRAYDTLNSCSVAGKNIEITDGHEACAEAVRAYHRAAAASKQSDVSSRHIQANASWSIIEILQRYVAGGDIVHLPLSLGIAERIEILEFLLPVPARGTVNGWRDHHGFWLAELYEAAGRRGDAKMVLDKLIAQRGNRPQAWAALYRRVSGAEGQTQ